MITTTNIPKCARIFKILCVALIPVVLLWSPLMWFFGDKMTDATYGLNLANFSFAQRIGLVLIELISNGLVSYGLILLARIANNFQKDEIFTTKTVGLFLRLQKITGYWASYTIGYFIFFHSVFTTTIPAYVLLASSATVAITYLFIFFFLSLLATLIVKATQLQGDQDLTV